MAKAKKTNKVAALKLEQVELSSLARLPGENPNKMSEHDFEALKASISNEDIGYLQPFLVSEDAAGNRVLVDGEHRVKALLELGYTHADVVVGPAQSARLLRLSMHLRGQSEDELVAAELQALNDSGYDLDFLADSTPFDTLEIADLLSGEHSPLVDLDIDLSKESKTPATPLDDEGGPPMRDESTHNITLRFTAKTDRDRVSQTLRDHGVTPEDALLNLLGLK